MGDVAVRASELIGGYQLGACIGRGRFTRVHRAWDRARGRDVWLKLLREECAADRRALALLRAEMQAGARLQHPNIVRMLGRSSDEGNEFAVIEDLKGSTARRVAQVEGPQSVDLAARTCSAVVDALVFARSRGFVHQRLDARNVFVSENGSAKVTYWGFHPRDQSGRGDQDRADANRVSALAYEMLTGEPVVEGEPPPALAELRADCPAALATAIDNCLNSPASVGLEGLAVAFEHAQIQTRPVDRDEGETTEVVAPSIPERKRRSSPIDRVSRWWPALAVASGIALLAAVVAWTELTSTPRSARVAQAIETSLANDVAQRGLGLTLERVTCTMRSDGSGALCKATATDPQTKRTGSLPVHVLMRRGGLLVYRLRLVPCHNPPQGATSCWPLTTRRTRNPLN
jgi:serine/threonine protein kinase